jgi:hypothetical protein
MRRQLRRLLVLLGVVHVLDAVAWSLLWRYRRSWARALWRAALDELAGNLPARQGGLTPARRVDPRRKSS